ncbi:ATP-binding protein [Streptomyces sp. ITFR-6]|uniref:ATP-binding protein n=1 Tax=Streptomyces sp. ITFR-6 TaxID=3075197 RepID=UPI002889FF37|nr:ATP-binding protein [Streptomyces sp. ITFR-6]WNI34465.1 ATP-binding protein [Streptomyces sp. ITFR-6]
MRLPIRHVAGNVMWTVHGQVWAVYRVAGADAAHASRRAKEQRLGQLEALVKALKGESMLLSLCPAVDPAGVVAKMTAGIDMVASPRYRQATAVLRDQLDQLELTGRTDWLAVPLPMGRGESVREAFAAARADVALQLGLLPRPVSAQEEDERLAQAQRMASVWPAGIALREATTAEVLWIYGHSARRGVLEPALPEGAGPRMRGRGRGAAAFGQVVLAEGGNLLEELDAGEGGDVSPGRGHAGRGKRVRGNPFARRWLEATTEWGPSYQVMLALSEMPEAFAFPGSEYLTSLDAFSFPVDWVVRLHVSSGAEAEAKTRRQANELANQYNELHNENTGTGVPATVDKAVGGLEEFRERLTASRTEVEVRAMTTLCVWGGTPEEAERRAGEITGHFGGNEYSFVSPRGEQENLWYGMLPGTRTPQVMAQYAQYLVAKDFAMAGPFSGQGLGDSTGPLFGLQLAGGGVRPVLTDWERGPRENTSATAAFIGELGAGKTTAMKSAVYSVLAAGRRSRGGSKRGRVVIVDRTPRQEWLRYAQACPGETECITIDDHATVSLDPLRTFKGREAQRFTESFLTLLLGLAPMSDEGIALSEAVEAVLAEPHPSMRVLVEELTNRGASGDPHSAMAARRLSAVRRKDLARSVFDESLPVVRGSSADALVFSVSSLTLPTKSELNSGRLDKLEFEKVFGRAVMYLIAALCRKIVYADLNEFALVVWDECWWLTSSPEGLALALELVRDGRKHGAGALFGAHDDEDIGSADTEDGQILRGLIPRKFVFRHTDTNLARRALAFLGCNPDDEDLLALVTTGLSPNSPDLNEEERAARAGECLHRDLTGRIGAMQVSLPADEQAVAHIHSQPMTSTTA